MKTFVTALLLIIPTLAFAQQGTVTYVEAIKLDMELPPEMAHMADEIPKSQTSTKVLYFNENAALMKDAPADSDEDGNIEIGNDNFQVKMVVADNESEFFSDFANGTLVEKRNFMGRKFIISGDGEPIAWKLTGNQSEYLGYLCQEATATRDSVNIVAWFTPEIPVSAGPATYSGLPGLILAVDIDGGNRAYTATKLSLDPVDPALIAAPTKGKQVTRSEFEQIMEEKMKEMGAERSGRGGFKITIDN